MTETLYDGKIVKVKKLGHEPKHKRPNEGKPYTLFDIVIEGEKKQKKFKMHLHPDQVTDRQIRCTKNMGPFMNGDYEHVIHILDGPNAGLEYSVWINVLK